ncbi:MAG: 3-deoxy-8-phosphooctulonate synthase [Bacteroidota bacterium]|nr:3-deoxy-8-phosphooctulonate synthase [Bacteroidota bacterium]
MDLSNLSNISYPNSGQYLLIAGPCAIEGEEMALRIAEKIFNYTDTLKIPFVFKGSYKKANRNRIDSFTGIGDKKALKILDKIRTTFDLPVLTDIHESTDAQKVAEFVDIIQIPAFLTRQTDIIVKAAKTGKTINLKKGQFMSPESMKFAVEKVTQNDNKNVWITERGTQFGYQDLLVDFRGIPIMKKFSPVILDVTHSIQRPNQTSGVTGGSPESIETIALAGIAAGADGIFIETHEDPSSAKSDGANMLNINKLKNLLSKLSQLRDVINKGNI